ncbi:YicC family protein [Desulfovibrio sp. OttesenSCG-928-F07]|nr:YicC family protein [Desulfovibrio sp. OttesenSCG-928-F07]
MLRSMTGFGRYYVEDDTFTQTWEVRSVNSRHLDLKWRLPHTIRSLEAAFEKVVRRYTSRGRIEISLNLQFSASAANMVVFNKPKAEAILEAVQDFADERGDNFEPDYNRLMGLSYLWEEPGLEPEGELGESLIKGLTLVLEDWNESREAEAKALEQDITGRILRMEEWVNTIEKRAPDIKNERVAVLHERISTALAESGVELEENRFLQEITLLADKLDVSEELTRLNAHLERLRELLQSGKDAGRRLDFTMQEVFREINTCGNKIQDSQISRLVVDFKNELEKCREQVQNIE